MNDPVKNVLDEIEDWRGGKLWGAPEIAAFAGCSCDTVRRWTNDKTCPISKPSGRLFVTRGDLIRWLKSRKAQPF